jgi:hypothetical protein
MLGLVEKGVYRIGKLVSNWFTVSLFPAQPPPGWWVGSTGGGLDGGRGE